MPDWPQHRDRLAGWLPDPAQVEFFARGYHSAYVGAVDTWASSTAALCVTPGVNMVSNIGVSGAHAVGPTASHFRATAPIPLASLPPAATVVVNREYDRVVMDYVSKWNRRGKSFAAKWRASFNNRMSSLRVKLHR